MSKYGFSGGIDLPKTDMAKPKPVIDRANLTEAVKAGNNLGFVSREPSVRGKPGPKRKEPQDKVSIPGPKRVTDQFRDFCTQNDLTLWQGLEQLLAEREGREG